MSRDIIKVNGVIIKEAAYKEYDKLLTILTKEKGKIYVYAYGVRRQSSKKIGLTRFLTFGRFELFESKNGYEFNDAKVLKCYDENIDYEILCYISYFIEIVDYFTYENACYVSYINLLYFAINSLIEHKIDYSLILAIFKIKILQYEGIYSTSDDLNIKNDTVAFAWDYILHNEVNKIFKFNLNDDCKALLNKIVEREYRLKVDKKFKTEEMLNSVF